MTHQFILLVPSVTGAVMSIIALGIVAAIIGYTTSWYYAKSVFVPVIKGLETDKVNLNKNIEGLNDDVRRLDGKVNNLNAKIARLDEEIEEKDKEIRHLKKPKK